jgi:F0F1-type ATP synthase membrane subunit b/b'
VRKIAAVILFAVLGLTVPLSAVGQISSDDSARIASQKHNAKRSRKEVKAQKHAMKKAMKKAGKPKKQQKRTYQTL